MKLVFVGGYAHGRIYDVVGYIYEVPIWEPVKLLPPYNKGKALKQETAKVERYKLQILYDSIKGEEVRFMSTMDGLDSIRFMLEEISHKER